jgi:hypothetical protein
LSEPVPQGTVVAAGKGGGSRSGDRRRVPGAGARRPRTGVAVDEEQRRHLIECCAFFNAARFRPAVPGEIRRQDLLEAEARIDAILQKHKSK